jgi:ribosomal protein S13
MNTAEKLIPLIEALSKEEQNKVKNYLFEKEQLENTLETEFSEKDLQEMMNLNPAVRGWRAHFVEV